MCESCGGGVGPPTKEVGCVIVMGNVVDVMVCLSLLSRLCCNSGIVCGLLVGFQLSVKTSRRMGALEQYDGAVVGVSWPLQSIEYMKCTLLALAATPLQ